MSSSKHLDEITAAQRKALAGGKAPDIRKSAFKGSNLATWSIERLQRELWRTYSVVKNNLGSEKNAVLVFGDQGCGKSEVVQSFAKNMATLYPQKTFLHFTDKNAVDNKKSIIENPEPYFIFLDLRASQLAEHQVGGVPNMPKSDVEGYLVWSPTDWTALVTNPKFTGYIFLDEVNRSDPAIVNSLFGLALDRMISGRRLSQNCFIAAAANLGPQFQGTTDLDPAFFGRFNVGFLVPNAQEWIAWAQKNGIDQSIIDFVALKPEENFIRNYPGSNKQSVNPRNLQKASDNLKWMHYSYDTAIADAAKDGITEPNAQQLRPYLQKFVIPNTDITAMTGDVYADYYDSIETRCGTEWTNEFMQYLRHVDEFRFEDVMEKLKKKYYHQKAGSKQDKELSSDKLFYLVRYLSDTFTSAYVNAWASNDKAKMDQVADWLATTFAGVPSDQISFILDRMIPSVQAYAAKVKGAPLSRPEASNLMMGGKNELPPQSFEDAAFLVRAMMILNKNGEKEVAEAIKDWITLNKRVGGTMKLGVKSEAGLPSPKKVFEEMVAFNPKTTYKPKFKKFYKSL